MAYFADPFGRAALDVQKDMSVEPDEYIPEVESGEATSAYRRGLHKMTFSWSSVDSAALAQINGAVDAMFADLFGGFFEEVEAMYEQSRIPKMNKYGQVIRDDRGRPCYELAESGKPKEDFSRLTGQDLDTFLIRSSELRLLIRRQVTELQLQAVFAKYSYNDERDDAFVEEIDGTIDDKSARSNRRVRAAKYHAFFRYALYQLANDFYLEMVNYCREIGKVREWRLRDDYNGRGFKS